MSLTRGGSLMSFTSVFQKLLHEHNEDDGILISAISAEMKPGNENQLAGKLLPLLTEHQEAAVRLGWDLVAMFCPHLTSDNAAVLLLLAHITQVCSPREMVLALLEQVESPSCNTVSFLSLLSMMKPVLLQVSPVIIASTLNSLALHMCKHSRGVTEPTPSLDEDSSEENTLSQYLTTSSFSTQCTQFIQPYVSQLHKWYGNSRDVATGSYSLVQHCCLAVLLQVLQTSSSQITATMDLVVQCHYGFLPMIEWTPLADWGHREDEDKRASLSPVGMALAVHSLLVDGVWDYVPQVISHGHLLVSSLTHVKCLLQMHDKPLLLKGVRLLECVVERVGRNQLPVKLVIESDSILHVPMLLSDLMVTCPHKSVRQLAVVLLPQFIASFSSGGRHRLYKNLLHRVEHAGIQGLLIHSVKEEVDAALRSKESLFLGDKLDALASLFITASEQMNIVTEYDRLMASLNFLRFLFLRDHHDHDETGVWSRVEAYQSFFLRPLRKALLANMNYCRTCLNNPSYTCDEGAQSPEMKVELVDRAVLPPPNSHEYREASQAMQVLLHRLDMMLSVLVRVEELAVVQ